MQRRNVVPDAISLPIHWVSRQLLLGLIVNCFDEPWSYVERRSSRLDSLMASNRLVLAWARAAYAHIFIGLLKKCSVGAVYRLLPLRVIKELVLKSLAPMFRIDKASTLNTRQHSARHGRYHAHNWSPNVLKYCPTFALVLLTATKLFAPTMQPPPPLGPKSTP